jgi:hypothetical protein
MPEPTKLPELSYRIVCYELQDDTETVILDTTARAFIAVTGTLDENGMMHGEGTHAGPLALLKRIARVIAAAVGRSYLAGRGFTPGTSHGRLSARRFERTAGRAASR